MPRFKDAKSLVLVRNLIIAEVIAYLCFMGLALAAYWAQVYRMHFPLFARYIPFTVLEFFMLGVVQVGLIVFVVRRHDAEELNIQEMIRHGEHEHLEFKTTLRWDVKRDQVNRELEKGIMKTIAAFLNSAGGRLVIGVDDQHQVYGLEADLASLTKQNHDGFENHFNNVFSSMIGPEFRKYVQLSFHYVHNQSVCLVEVKRGDKPAYLKTDKGEDFFIRTGNATTPLRMSQAASYVSTQWR